MQQNDSLGMQGDSEYTPADRAAIYDSLAQVWRRDWPLCPLGVAIEYGHCAR